MLINTDTIVHVSSLWINQQLQLLIVKNVLGNEIYVNWDL